MDYWTKDIYSWAMQLNCNSKNGSDVVNFLSTQWSTDGSTSSEPMRLCMTPIVKTLTDNHTLDDRNHQGHHTTLLLSETLLSTAQASLCVGEVRSLESTGRPCGEFWSQISTCILAGYRLNKSTHFRKGMFSSPDWGLWVLKFLPIFGVLSILSTTDMLESHSKALKTRILA